MHRLTIAIVVAGVALGGTSCSVGTGSGEVHSDELKAPGCFYGAYDLGPTFFASNPFRNSQEIRVQRRNDFIENSDGVEVLVRDTAKIRASLGQSLRVGLTPDVVPPGVPITPDPDPPIVSIVLYLHETCHGQNIALYATQGSITFEHLFDGDPNESDAESKLTHATFDVYVGDPRDEPPAGGPIPAAKLSHVVGEFRFYFQRGQPAQPFP